MPVYEYECKKCGDTFEQLVSLAERDRPRECPACGASDVERQVSGFSMGGRTRKSSSCGTGGGG